MKKIILVIILGVLIGGGYGFYSSRVPEQAFESHPINPAPIPEITKPEPVKPEVPVVVPAHAEPINILGLTADTNKERVAAGLGALALSSALDSSASAKCIDMQQKNYWSHNSPDGKTPWTFINTFTPIYYKAGENLAYGYKTNEAVTAGWMNSPSHRANILDPVFKNVGFGICDFRGTKLVVQHFSG